MGYVQKRLFHEPLSSYYIVVKCTILILILIFQCVLGGKSQSIDLKNAFSHEDIPGGKPAFIELPRDFNSGGGKCDVVIMLKKSLYGQSEAARLWYEKF